jgi:hypothetical protein
VQRKHYSVTHRLQKTIRVFVSSTFEDMKNERGHFVKHVFPELERYCASRGWQFSTVGSIAHRFKQLLPHLCQSLLALRLKLLRYFESREWQFSTVGLIAPVNHCFLLLLTF